LGEYHQPLVAQRGETVQVFTNQLVVPVDFVRRVGVGSEVEKVPARKLNVYVI
jgi:hypothetical protein